MEICKYKCYRLKNSNVIRVINIQTIKEKKIFGGSNLQKYIEYQENIYLYPRIKREKDITNQIFREITFDEWCSFIKGLNYVHLKDVEIEKLNASSDKITTGGSNAASAFVAGAVVGSVFD